MSEATTEATTGPVDLVLSSGFLAFARHTGFLAAVEELELDVAALCGTSSGALVGALWAAGHRAEAIAAELSSEPPSRMMRFHWRLWQGATSMEAVVERLRGLLPPTFADLDRPFAVGVRGTDRRYHLLSQGPLPESVAASCCIPAVFAPVRIAGVPWRDGGTVNRVGLGPWRELRSREHRTVVHLIERTVGRDVADGLDEVSVVRSPRSGASFWNLGDFAGEMDATRRAARAELGAAELG